MNILILINHNPFCSSSASANRWLTLIEGLANLGVQIKLLIYGGYQTENEVINWKTFGVKNGINYKYLEPRLVMGFFKQRYYIYIGFVFQRRRLSKLIFQELKHYGGLVWTDSSHFGFELAVKIRKKISMLKLFLEMSEFLDIHKNNKGNILQRWQANVKQLFFEEKAYYSYDGMALMTQTLMKHYQVFPKPQPKLLHLPMTVDLARFNSVTELRPELQSPYIAFLGVMNDAKDGVSFLIKAYNLIKSKFPLHRVYLVGGWHYDTPIHLQLIKDFHLEERVYWVNEYPRDAIPSIICNADLLVLPRPDSKQAQGGFPTKLGEYLATGKPVCATRVGEIPNYLTDNESVFFAQPGSVESFAEAMERALGDYENAVRVGANGRKVAEEYFNKDLQARKLLAFLEELVSKS
ncbi:MAG: glycosyltransferase family 4 protein [Candidatus Staskawiczbacteria bacterium]|nr:glycosyltransferase family 4 protein [Candidatus Staskawiczbacteria bacterium]